MLQHFVVVLLLLGCVTQEKSPDSAVSAPLLDYQVVASYPHDIRHYTEGLLLHDGRLLESTGRYGQSGLYEVDRHSGATLRSHALDARYFGEGIAVAGDRIVQLTWREQTALVYNLALEPLTQLQYPGEGWGLASSEDGKTLVMSDGSSRLSVMDAGDYHGLRRIEVRDGGREVFRLNELEMVRGLIFANVWLSDRIAVIDPGSGAVLRWLDLSALKDRFAKPADWDERDHVLNGIAYDPHSGHLLVTGKCWPVLFELQLGPLPRATSDLDNRR